MASMPEEFELAHEAEDATEAASEATNDASEQPSGHQDMAEAMPAAPGGGDGGRDEGLFDQVREAAEQQLQNCVAASMSLVDLLRAEPVDAIFRGVEKTMSSLEQIKLLRDAIGSSHLVEAKGSRAMLRKADTAWCPDYAWAGHAEQGMYGAFAGDQGDASMQLGSPMHMVPPLLGDGEGSSSWDSTQQDWFGLDYMVDPSWAAFASMPQQSSAWYGGALGWSPQLEEQPQGSAYERTPEQRRQWIGNIVEQMLRFPVDDVAENMQPDGFVHIGHMFATNPMLSRICFGKPHILLRTLRATRRCFVVADEESQTVRLMTLHEQLCTAAEDVLKESCRHQITVAALLEHPAMQSLLSEASASSRDVVHSREAILREALSHSDLLELDAHGGAGDEAVVVWSPERLLREVVEQILDQDMRMRALLDKDREVAISQLLECQPVIRALDRAVVPLGEAALAVIRGAVDGSSRYVLDSPRLCVRQVATAHSRPPVAAGAAPEEGKRAWTFVPRERDVKNLRELLTFYFSHFNLQHNRVLLAVVEAQRQRQRDGVRDADSRRTGYLRSGGLRPTFTIEQIRVLPRIAQLFDSYSPEVWPCFAAAALCQHSAEPLPARICTRRDPGSPLGAWALRDPRLELTYVPSFRSIEVVRGRPEARSLLVVEDDPIQQTLAELPPHAFSVVSYSVSSDISHGQSPKAVNLIEDIMDGDLDACVVSWDYREQRIKRQLYAVSADIICIQCLQSVGYAARCSEEDSAWFTCDDEPSTNHLVHLYRKLSKINYGVAFAPTLEQPGSDVACFGNAIFWKRSRWQLVQHTCLQGGTICVELASRLRGPPLLVCNTKTAATYAKDWGDDVSDEELAAALGGVQAVLAETVYARRHGQEEHGPGWRALSSGPVPRLVWCGDFGCEVEALLPEVEHATMSQWFTERRGGNATAAPTGTGSESDHDGHLEELPPLPSWKSACACVLGADPWTSSSPATAGQAVDVILHDGLEAIAALGGMHDSIELKELLRAGSSGVGNPSDHLMQFAVFVDGETDPSHPSLQQAWPTLAGATQRCNSRSRSFGGNAAARATVPGRSKSRSGRVVSRSGSVAGQWRAVGRSGSVTGRWRTKPNGDA